MDALLAEKLRFAAYHESGHAVFAEAFTGSAASIELRLESRDGASWVKGRCLHSTTSDRRANRLIGLGGACAEVLAGPHGASAGDALLHPICSRISGTDAAMAGIFSRSDVDECLSLCHRLWPQIDARARREIAGFSLRGGAGTSLTIRRSM